MNMQEIRGIAKDCGINATGLNKLKLIQVIQLSEGNFNCYASAKNGECDQLNCTWRADCFVAAKKNLS